MNDEIRNFLNNELLAVVNEIAGQKILAIAPLWKQANLTARVTEIAYNATLQNRPLTSEEAAEVETYRPTWERITAIRAASNTHVANLQALETMDAVRAYNYTVGWPE